MSKTIPFLPNPDLSVIYSQKKSTQYYRTKEAVARFPREPHIIPSNAHIAAGWPPPALLSQYLFFQMWFRQQDLGWFHLVH